MMTRRELLLGGTAAFAAAGIGRSAWAATPATSSSAPAIASAVTAAAGPSPFDAIIGESPAVVAFRDSLRALLDRAAGLPRPPLVVLLGETGTGKDLAAQVIHSAGSRSAGPYLRSDLVYIPFELLEGELWGWAKGGFPHQTEQSGVWEVAHGGTVYLDQIGQLGVEMWPKVARVLKTGAVWRLGDARARNTDTWTIASSSQGSCLHTLVGEQTLEEFLAPLNPVIVTVPPLRARGDDIQLLADHFAAEHCRVWNKPLKVFTPAARDVLSTYVWPGNIRQLSNTIERAVILCEDREIGADVVPASSQVASVAGGRP